MKLKRHINFINENYSDDVQDHYEQELYHEISEAERFLKDLGAEKVDGRWNYDSSLVVDKKIVYKGKLLVPFGVISGDFSCHNESLRNESLKNLPTKVIGDLILRGNHFTDLKDFNVEFSKSIDLSHNHLHNLKNMPNKVNGIFDISSNMITSLEGCPEEVDAFKAKDNWFNTLKDAPKKVLKWHSGNYRRRGSGADVEADDKKIPEIELEFYLTKSYYDAENDGTGNFGITNYWTELYKYLMNKFKFEYRDDKEKGDIERDKAITSVKWPNDVKGDLLKKSVTAVSKFGL